MKNTSKIYIAILFFAVGAQLSCLAQNSKFSDTLPPFTSKSAGPEYKRSSFHEMLWGKNYRREWSTSIKVPVILLDTLKGGLIPYQEGGGHQSKSLRLHNNAGKEYALRSVNKTVSKLVPETYQNTFIQAIVQDEISMSHPYGAVAIPVMAQSAGILHTNPEFVFLPHQQALDTFNNKYGNDLYLFEQKAGGNWKDANNLGNFTEFIGTDELVQKILDDNDQQVDQHNFLKARLFDMLIGDWDRHEDQWKWGETDTKSNMIEVVPEDRDQAFFKYSGILSKLFISAAGTPYLQSFSNNISNVKIFNYEERNLDRFFTNRLTLEDWQNTAKELQQSLTDDVIETSVKQLPPEVFTISGNEIISKLKARREHLVEWATTYYLFLAKEVQIVGSKEKEHFQIKQLNSDSTIVNIYSVNKTGKQNTSPFYSRVFKSQETKEIRLYGISGKDNYTIDDNTTDGIKVRIIGGLDRDSIIEHGAAKRIDVYDDADNFFSTGKRTKFHLSNDTSIHSFNYNGFVYDKKGFKPSIFYSNEDRLYVGLGYGLTHNAWRKQPFVSRQLLEGHYSVMEKAFSATYSALFPKVVGKWDLTLLANYDAIRWTNFFGLGNETKLTVGDINYHTMNYYRMRTEQWIFRPGGTYRFGKSIINVSGFLQSIRIINDNDRLAVKTFDPIDPNLLKPHVYAGGQVSYTFLQLNDPIVPTKGYIFSATGIGSRNLTEAKSVVTYFGNMQFFIPLVSKFSLSVRAGAATVTGDPEFYQYTSIGGPILRGFRRDRFWGKTAFYNQNDLRFITNARTNFYKGKAGMLVFFDNGRVWLPSEKSNTWHTGYGGGITLAPFKRVYGDVTYGFSKDGGLLQVRINTYF